ncbi:pilus assembly protein [Desulfococcus sp.]|uniref:pilus assembly protein n=1 Tax=Desulfococcus sp. TaxID=2025834 RepID=UPI0035946B8A
MSVKNTAPFHRGLILLVAAVILCLASAGSAVADGDTVIAGCALPVTSPDYSEGFVLEDFDVTGIILNDNGDLQLDTQSKQLDPSNIEIPIDQEVSVTFLYEGAGFTHSRFGWMYETDVTGTGGPDVTKIRWLYTRINDNDNDGALDFPAEVDANGDGAVNAKDNKKFLVDAEGKPIVFKAGSKLVFVLDSRLMYGTANPACSNAWCGGLFYTKQDWNENLGEYGNCATTYGGVSRIVRLYQNGNEGNTNCYNYFADCSAAGAACHTQGWMDQAAIDRLKALYGYEFRDPATGDPAGFNEVELQMVAGRPSIHAILGAPNNTPNAWILGFDDTKLDGTSTNDFDFNDLVFLIERITGGMASLKQTKTISPADDDAFYTRIEFEVEDAMPCPGVTGIDYFYSVNYEKDAEGNYLLDEVGAKKPIWYKIGTEENPWVTVYSFTDEDGGPSLTEGEPNISQSENLAGTWKAGYPAYTYRKAEIDLVAGNNVGRDLLWKAELRSESELCAPVVLDVKLNGTVARHAFFSRSSPIIQTNLIYSGSYETPDPLDNAWMSDPELRGHLKAVQIYDPDTLETTLGTDGANVKWDAGQVLKNRDLTSDPRTIYFPNMTAAVHTVTITDGVDGTTKDFTGTIENYPVLDGTFVVGAQTEDEEGIIRSETLKDVYTNDVLDTETPGASGKVNRFTGAYEIHFSHPPKADTGIVLTYTSYETTVGTPEILGTGNAKVTDALLNIGGTGINKEKLIKWVLGFKDDGTERTWPLGPVDHSAAAVMTPPGIPAWYYVEEFSSDLKSSFYDPDPNNTSTFAATHKNRKVTVFVGSLDGMLHAFDGGTFSWEDNKKTTQKEERGHFVWSGEASSTAQYGTGEELWAYIPGNLVSKMKNNYSKQDLSKALVDASPAISDVYIGGSWRTVLIFAQGSGGHMITCLDVTEPELPTLLWEFGDPGLFRSQSSPSIGMVKDSGGGAKWVSFWVSGYTDPGEHPGVYMVDVADGTLVGGAKMTLDAAGSEGMGGIGSGQPALVDSDGDGFADRFYVGTDKGYMYRVDISNIASPSDSVINGSERDAERGIYGSPAVVVEEDGVRILFGTGGDAATDDSFSYKFYAYLDTKDGASLDWSYTLDAQERVYTSAFVAAGQVYFGTTTATSEDPCAAGGDNTGNLYAFSTKLETPDSTPAPLSKIPLPTGSGRVSPIVDDEHVYIKTTNGLLKSYGGAGYNNAAAGVASEDWGSKVFMRSWREIF